MSEKLVTVEKAVPLTTALHEETPVNVEHSGCEAEARSSNRVVVRITDDGACWISREFKLADTPWSVYHVQDGEHGPRVIFQREA